jgi:hypothetical protein
MWITAAVNLLGPLLGFGSGWINKWMDSKAEAAKRDHEIAMRRVDGELMKLEAEAKIQVSRGEAEAKTQVAESEAFGEAIRAEAVNRLDGAKLSPAQTWVMVGLEALRGSVRPVLTIYLCILATMLYFKAAGMAGMMDTVQAGELVREITIKILFIFEVSISFWFGTRAKK